VVTLVLAVVLGQLFGTSGVAASIAFGAWSSTLSLIRHGAATFGFSLDAAARRRLPRMVAAALAMGGALWWAAPLLRPLGAGANGLVEVLIVAALISGGMAVYGLLLVALGAFSSGEAVNAFRQNASPGLRD